MTLWEWVCAIDGYAEVNGIKRRGDISEDRLAAMGIEGF
jgi:hypothetical protein